MVIKRRRFLNIAFISIVFIAVAVFLLIISRGEKIQSLYLIGRNGIYDVGLEKQWLYKDFDILDDLSVAVFVSQNSIGITSPTTYKIVYPNLTIKSFPRKFTGSSFAQFVHDEPFEFTILENTLTGRGIVNSSKSNITLELPTRVLLDNIYIFESGGLFCFSGQQPHPNNRDHVFFIADVNKNAISCQGDGIIAGIDQQHERVIINSKTDVDFFSSEGKKLHSIPLAKAVSVSPRNGWIIVSKRESDATANRETAVYHFDSAKSMAVKKHILDRSYLNLPPELSFEDCLISSAWNPDSSKVAFLIHIYRSDAAGANIVLEESVYSLTPSSGEINCLYSKKMSGANASPKWEFLAWPANSKVKKE